MFNYILFQIVINLAHYSLKKPWHVVWILPSRNPLDARNRLLSQEWYGFWKSKVNFFKFKSSVLWVSVFKSNWKIQSPSRVFISKLKIQILFPYGFRVSAIFFTILVYLLCAVLQRRNSKHWVHRAKQELNLLNIQPDQEL